MRTVIFVISQLESARKRSIFSMLRVFSVLSWMRWMALYMAWRLGMDTSDRPGRQAGRDTYTRELG